MTHAWRMHPAMHMCTLCGTCNWSRAVGPRALHMLIQRPGALQRPGSTARISSLCTRLVSTGTCPMPMIMIKQSSLGLVGLANRVERNHATNLTMEVCPAPNWNQHLQHVVFPLRQAAWQASSPMPRPRPWDGSQPAIRGLLPACGAGHHLPLCHRHWQPRCLSQWAEPRLGQWRYRTRCGRLQGSGRRQL